jgi:hypothetical protein
MLCKMESLTFDSSNHNRMQKNTKSNHNDLPAFLCNLAILEMELLERKEYLKFRISEIIPVTLL